MSDAATFTATIQRKEAFLPRYIVVPPDHVIGHSAAFAADVWLNGTGPFARTIRPWEKGLADYFFNLTEPQCRKAGVDTGMTCTVTLVPRP